MFMIISNGRNSSNLRLHIITWNFKRNGVLHALFIFNYKGCKSDQEIFVNSQSCSMQLKMFILQYMWNASDQLISAQIYYRPSKWATTLS